MSALAVLRQGVVNRGWITPVKRSFVHGACLVLAGMVTGCASSNVGVGARRPASLLIAPQQRILVAGFVTDDSDAVDVNAETVRLLRSELRRQGVVSVIAADPMLLKDEAVFANTDYWRRVGEEYGSPLIVTGVIRLRSASPNVVQRSGRGGVYVVEPGFFLDARVVTIDGATGRMLSSEVLPRQVRHSAGRRGSPLFLYSAMMEGLMPAFLQSILGAR